MSVKLIIWIIIGIVYLISRSRKKSQQPPVQGPGNFEPENTSKPVSFEDLLKEIQASKAPQPEPKPVATYKDYDEEPEEKPAVLENTNYNYRNHDQIYDTYEKAKQAAFLRPSMEETLKLEKTEVTFGQFKGYQIEEKPTLAAEFAKDPANFRKAFILSEILNKKF